MLENIVKNLRAKKPIVHNITNYVTVNDCANIILGIGGSPIMADDLAEVEEIVSLCGALVINIGTLNERTVASMIKAGKRANALGIPVILDPVGIGASALRTDATNLLIKEIHFSVIRGNASEIKMAYLGIGGAKGVDADASDSFSDGLLETAQAFAVKTGAVVAITGETDIIADKNKTALIQNGHHMMTGITGTGCMCSAVIGSFCGSTNDYFSAAAAGVAVMGIAGEIAFEKITQNQQGNGSFKTYLIDAVSQMDDNTLQKLIKIMSVTGGI